MSPEELQARIDTWGMLLTLLGCLIVGLATWIPRHHARVEYERWNNERKTMLKRVYDLDKRGGGCCYIEGVGLYISEGMIE